MTWRVVEAPTKEPVTVDEAITHLREDIGFAQASYIMALIRAARQHVESITGYAALEQIWEVPRRSFPASRGPRLQRWAREEREPLYLPGGNIKDVVSIKYVDTDGETKDYEDFHLRKAPPPLVEPLSEWPATADRSDAVLVRIKVGHETPEAVPEPLRQAMLLLIGHWYANREAVNVGNIVNEYPMAVDALLQPYVDMSRI